MLRPARRDDVRSIVLWLVSRQMGWNLSAYPGGTVIQPVSAGRCCRVRRMVPRSAARGNPSRSSSRLTRSISALPLSDLGLVMTMAGKFTDFGALFPHWLYSTFNPNDKTFLAPYRLRAFG